MVKRVIVDEKKKRISKKGITNVNNSSRNFVNGIDQIETSSTKTVSKFEEKRLSLVAMA